jgi:hypothetical protein
MVEHLPSQCEALSSNSSISKKKKNHLCLQTLENEITFICMAKFNINIHGESSRTGGVAQVTSTSNNIQTPFTNPNKMHIEMVRGQELGIFRA